MQTNEIVLSTKTERPKRPRKESINNCPRLRFGPKVTRSQKKGSNQILTTTFYFASYIHKSVAPRRGSPCGIAPKPHHRPPRSAVYRGRRHAPCVAQ